MTSGEFKPFPLDEIVVDRPTRQRRNLEEIDGLAESIGNIGLIHPIVITREGVLVAGERRLSAVKSLGWTNVPVQFVDELDPDALHLIELEENIRRSDLTWQEEALAVSEYHRLRGDDMEKTASELGVKKAYVQQKVQVVSAFDNDRVKNASTFSSARNIVAREHERSAANALESLDIDEPSPAVKDDVPLLNEDFVEWQRTYDGPKFNMIHCDFPYGINANNQQQGNNVEQYGSYEDSEDIYWSLLDTLERGMENVVAESAHLIFWFSMRHFAQTFERLEAMGWRVNPHPLVWLKNDNTGLLPDPNRGPRQIYETALFASRGDRKIVQAVSNAFAAPGKGKSIHMSEKPVEMLHHFMRMTVDEHSYVLDPTAGSANAVQVARRLGATKVLGLEIDPDFYKLAKENLRVSE